MRRQQPEGSVSIHTSQCTNQFPLTCKSNFLPAHKAPVLLWRLDTSRGGLFKGGCVLRRSWQVWKGCGLDTSTHHKVTSYKKKSNHCDKGHIANVKGKLGLLKPLIAVMVRLTLHLMGQNSHIPFLTNRYPIHIQTPPTIAIWTRQLISFRPLTSMSHFCALHHTVQENTPQSILTNTNTFYQATWLQIDVLHFTTPCKYLPGPNHLQLVSG